MSMSIEQRQLTRVGHALVERFNLTPLTAADFRRMRDEIGLALGGECEQDDLGVILNRTRQNISRYENARIPIPQEISLLVRLLHRDILRSNELYNLQLKVEQLEKRVGP